VARKLSLEEFSNLLESISTLTDELPIEIDLVNLTKADSAFFETMRSGCKFLGGSPLSYGALMKRMYE
jgi:hypothetical protein